MIDHLVADDAMWHWGGKARSKCTYGIVFGIIIIIELVQINAAIV